MLYKIVEFVFSCQKIVRYIVGIFCDILKEYGEQLKFVFFFLFYVYEKEVKGEGCWVFRQKVFSRYSNFLFVGEGKGYIVIFVKIFVIYVWFSVILDIYDFFESIMYIFFMVRNRYYYYIDMQRSVICFIY